MSRDARLRGLSLDDLRAALAELTPEELDAVLPNMPVGLSVGRILAEQWAGVVERREANTSGNLTQLTLLLTKEPIDEPAWGVSMYVVGATDGTVGLRLNPGLGPV